MKIGAIVQARMSSRRFPGKVLHEVAGKPMLQFLLERLAHCSSIEEVIVATSCDPSDDALAEFCRKYDVGCHSGPLDDVASRFLAAAEDRRYDAFVRVSGDSPLLDPRLIDKAVSLFRSGDYDLVTNVLERTYPSGQSVEALRTETFRSAYALMTEAVDLEHVTTFFYRNNGEYRIHNFVCEPRRNAIHMSVDTPEDMSRFSATVACMVRPHWEYGLEEVVALHSSAGRSLATSTATNNRE